MENETKNFSFDECFVDGVQRDTITTLLGLTFPESANDFQKCALTLAHMMAILRDFVLKGRDIPDNLLLTASLLASAMQLNGNNQR